MRSTMNISLPTPLKAWVEDQVSARGYSTASEFVRDVLRREQAAAAKARVEAHLLESLESGPATPMTRKDWERIRSEGIALSRRRKAK
jgi:antitoxin ParD1/3/4